MKTLDICIDLETLGQSPDSAILSIGAVLFSRDGSMLKELQNIDTAFEQYVGPFSNIVFGHVMERPTCEWWASRPKDLKEKMFMNIMDRGISLKSAMEQLIYFIRSSKEQLAPDRIFFWSQGKDFDFPILTHALIATGICSDRDHLPWKYTQLRDARDYVLEGIEELYGITDRPYDKLEKYTGEGEPHTALYDACRSAHNVTEVWNLKHSANP